MPFSRPFLALPPPSLLRVPKVIFVKKKNSRVLFWWMFSLTGCNLSGVSIFLQQPHCWGALHPCL